MDKEDLFQEIIKLSEIEQIELMQKVFNRQKKKHEDYVKEFEKREE